MSGDQDGSCVAALTPRIASQIYRETQITNSQEITLRLKISLTGTNPKPELGRCHCFLETNAHNADCIVLVALNVQLVHLALVLLHSLSNHYYLGSHYQSSCLAAI